MEHLRDDLPERCDLAREGNSERKLALEVRGTSNASFVASALPARAFWCFFETFAVYFLWRLLSFLRIWETFAGVLTGFLSLLWLVCLAV
ncbi:hypothetical protein ACLD52_02700 [Gardnerella leopoldii]